MLIAVLADYARPRERRAMRIYWPSLVAATSCLWGVTSELLTHNPGPGDGMRGMFNRLENDRLAIHYAAAYMGLLKSATPPATDGLPCTHHEFVPAIGSYNPDLRFAAASQAGIDYFYRWDVQ